MSVSDDYRRLCRLREKRARLQKHITRLEAKLRGRKPGYGIRPGDGNKK